MGCGGSKPADKEIVFASKAPPGQVGLPGSAQQQQPPPKPPRRGTERNSVGERVLVDGASFELRKLLHQGCSTVWEAEGGGWGVVVLKVCDHGRSDSAAESQRRKSDATLSKLPFETELKVRKALGPNAKASTIAVVASDEKNHVLVLERAECSLERYLEDTTGEFQRASARASEADEAGKQSTSRRRRLGSAHASGSWAASARPPPRRRRAASPRAAASAAPTPHARSRLPAASPARGPAAGRGS